jgi:hypothetical protein
MSNVWADTFALSSLEKKGAASKFFNDAVPFDYIHFDRSSMSHAKP